MVSKAFTKNAASLNTTKHKPFYNGWDTDMIPDQKYRFKTEQKKNSRMLDFAIGSCILGMFWLVNGYALARVIAG